MRLKVTYNSESSITENLYQMIRSNANALQLELAEQNNLISMKHYLMERDYYIFLDNNDLSPVIVLTVNDKGDYYYVDNLIIKKNLPAICKLEFLEYIKNVGISSYEKYFVGTAREELFGFYQKHFGFVLYKYKLYGFNHIAFRNVNWDNIETHLENNILAVRNIVNDEIVFFDMETKRKIGEKTSKHKILIRQYSLDDKIYISISIENYEKESNIDLFVSDKKYVIVDFEEFNIAAHFLFKQISDKYLFFEPIIIFHCGNYQSYELAVNLEKFYELYKTSRDYLPKCTLDNDLPVSTTVKKVLNNTDNMHVEFSFRDHFSNLYSYKKPLFRACQCYAIDNVAMSNSVILRHKPNESHNISTNIRTIQRNTDTQVLKEWELENSTKSSNHITYHSTFGENVNISLEYYIYDNVFSVLIIFENWGENNISVEGEITIKSSTPLAIKAYQLISNDCFEFRSNNTDCFFPFIFTVSKSSKFQQAIEITLGYENEQQ